MDAQLRHIGALGEDVLEAHRTRQHPDREDAERKTEVADPVDDEGLDGGSVG